jgi:hypothetical protein
VTAPWLTRALLLVEKRLLPRVADARGFLADASIALAVVGMIGLLLSTRRWWGRALASFVCVAFVAVTFAVYEVVSTFDSLHAINHARYLVDPTFLGGSVRNMTHPVLFAAAVVAGALGTVTARVPGRAWWRGWTMVLGAGVLCHAIFPMSQLYDGWRQRHAVHALVSSVPISSGRGSASVGAEVRSVFSADLGGERWLGPFEDRPNIVLVMIEGASGASLPSVAAEAGIESAAPMPKLDALAKNHLLFSNVVAHQRQTNRGEYAILCGDYPKLSSDQSKMTEQVYGQSRRCLPAALRDEGYATAYMQAAPLGFMLKDQFMKKAGFEELVGDSSFERSYARTDWGVDDQAFFEQAVERIFALHASEQPFFVTLLTVGTHHPFTLPSTDAREGPQDRRARAFLWADDALHGFIEALETHGVLEDTIVIITSDESAGLVETSSVAERIAAQSWSFALVMLPTPKPERIDELVGHVDVALSVTDVLGFVDELSPFIGRSWFRRYDSPRKLFAGNTYLRRVLMWEPETILICDEGFRDCKRHGRVKGSPFHPRRRGRPATPRERRILEEVARLSRSGRPEMTRVGALKLIEREEITIRAADGKKLIVGGQYLRVPAGTVLRVDFDLEVEGRGARVALDQDVFLDGYERFARKDVQVSGGERWRLRYEIGVPDDSTQLVVQLYATTMSGRSATLRVREARLTMRDAPRTTRLVEVIEDEVR